MVLVFLDESGTDDRSSTLLAGALVAPDAASIEKQVVEAHARILSDSMMWDSDTRRERFRTRGFHHSEDSVSIRQEFVQEIRLMNVRAHIAHMNKTPNVSNNDVLINMFYSLTKNIMLRYRTQETVFIFEQESAMNAVYGKIIAIATIDASRVAGNSLRTRALIGDKSAPALSVIDYLLAIAAHALEDKPKPFEALRFKHALSPSLAHLIDFDNQLHKSARKGVELP